MDPNNWTPGEVALFLTAVTVPLAIVIHALLSRGR